jgi:hypothetical protein
MVATTFQSLTVNSYHSSKQIAPCHFFQETTMNKLCAGALIAACAVAVTLFAVRTAPPAAAQGGGPAKAQATPLVSGMLVGVDVWNHPVEKGGNANASVKQGRVEVYDHFIILISLDGTRSLYPHGWYTNLRFQSQ